MIGQRSFGAGGAQLPILGFGVSGPHGTRLVPRRLTSRLIRQALEAGACLFDTAPFYGEGEAETRLGTSLSGARDRAFLCSKAGTVSKGREVLKDFSPGGLVSSVEASLRRLRTSWLDALFLHGPAIHHLNDETIAVLDRLKNEGKTRFAGVCGRGPEIEAAIASGCFDLIMAPSGPAVAKLALARASAAREAGMGLLGIEIMSGVAWAWRVPRSAPDLWYLARTARRRMSGLRSPSPRSGPTSFGPERDLAWALASKACDCAIVTTTRSHHLAANIAVAERAGTSTEARRAQTF